VTPRLGTNGTSERITLSGDPQRGFGERFITFRERLPLLLTVYVAGLVAASSALTIGFVFSGVPVGNLWAVLALSCIAAASERGRVRLANELEVSISLLPALFAAVLFGPFAAMIVGAASFLSHLHHPYAKWIVFTSSRAITWATSGLFAGYVGGLTHGRLGAIALTATVGVLSAQVLDTAFVALTYRLRNRGSMGSVFRTFAPLALSSVPLFTPLVVLLALAYERVSPWTLLLFFVPGLGAQRLFVMYQEQRHLAEELASANARLERANLSFATALVATLDARDRYTAGHSAAVAIYARDIAARLGLNEEQQQLAHLCGLVHDIGKTGLPPGLLEKPGVLTLEERRQMQEHSAIGERILRKVEDYSEIAAIVRHHHERWDGEGYPDRVAGESIPLLSRIVAVADAYNAMTSDRPYRDAMPSRVARMRLAQAVESQFDTSAVAAFEAVLAGATEDYRSGVREDFSLASQDPWSEDGSVADAA
jgi:putative nucleotidyltransferase with HDIG domain